MEGFTEAKRVTLQNLMLERNIGIICMQETHRSKADYYITAEGFLVILSGSDVPPEHAGVGFLVAPDCCRCCAHTYLHGDELRWGLTSPNVSCRVH